MYQLVVTYKKSNQKSNFDEEIHNYFIKNGMKAYDSGHITSRQSNECDKVVRYIAEKSDNLRNQSFYFNVFFKMVKLWKEQKWKRENQMKIYNEDGWFCGEIPENDNKPRPITDYITSRLEFIDTTRTIEIDDLI